MVSVIVLTPYWSAFSDAYAKHDYKWMNNSFSKLTHMALMSIPVLILMLLFAPIFFKIWVGDSVSIPFKLNAMVALYIMSQIFSGIHTYIINGLGKVTLQVILYVILSLFAIPAMNYLSLHIGLYGILSVLISVYLAQAILCRVQIKRILKNTACGLWNM